MRELLRLLVIIAIAAMIGVNLANTFRPLLFLWYGPPDFVTKSEERLAPLPKSLPATGEIGYVGDAMPGDATADPEATRKYYLTQYALAPRVMIPTPTPRLPISVADFDQRRTRIAPNDSSVHDVGLGVFVIKQKEK
jgi:hypothetical protein